MVSVKPHGNAGIRRGWPRRATLAKRDASRVEFAQTSIWCTTDDQPYVPHLNRQMNQAVA